MDGESERTTNDGVGSVRRRVVRTFWSERYWFHCSGGYTKTKLIDTLAHSKTRARNFNHHDLVDNVAIFTTPALVCYCSRDLSIRRTFARVKVRQALTSYLVVHLTGSTTLTVHV